MGVIPTTVTFNNFFAGGGATFQEPLYFSELPGKPGYYVVLEQHLGQVSVATKNGATWTKSVLLRLPAVDQTNEMGLLGIAFHPGFPTNHKYYINYNPTATRTLVVGRHTDASLILDDPTIAPDTLFSIAQPYTNHNGGTMAFGPTDGYLYIGMGDGGSGGDPQNHAQTTNDLLGKFLRVDVDRPANGKKYGIPVDNPFVGNAAYAQEIFSLGERNPWKWSIDPVTAILWLGHVGQNVWESAVLVPKGSNLGWRVEEGGHCYNPATGCNMTGFQQPFIYYAHTDPAPLTGNCIIGGHVYRGNPASAFYGIYFAGDNGTGRVWAFRTDGVTTQEYVQEGIVGGLTSFGIDLAGNLFAVARGGIIYQLGGPDLQPVPVWQPERKSGKTLAPVFDRGLSGLDLRDLRGKRVSGRKIGNGLYVTKDAGNLPALVPVLQ